MTFEVGLSLCKSLRKRINQSTTGQKTRTAKMTNLYQKRNWVSFFGPYLQINVEKKFEFHNCRKSSVDVSQKHQRSMLLSLMNVKCTYVCNNSNGVLENTGKSSFFQMQHINNWNSKKLKNSQTRYSVQIQKLIYWICALTTVQGKLCALHIRVTQGRTDKYVLNHPLYRFSTTNQSPP